jgi:hypothetical protein
VRVESPKDLRRHESTHSKHMRLPCVACKTTFTRTDNMKRHLVNVHKFTSSEAQRLTINAKRIVVRPDPIVMRQPKDMQTSMPASWSPSRADPSFIVPNQPFAGRSVSPTTDSGGSEDSLCILSREDIKQQILNRLMRSFCSWWYSSLRQRPSIARQAAGSPHAE